MKYTKKVIHRSFIDHCCTRATPTFAYNCFENKWYEIELMHPNLSTYVNKIVRMIKYYIVNQKVGQILSLTDD